MRKFILIVLLMISCDAKELFTPQKIFLYLNDTNPNFYKNIGEQKVSKSKELVYKGAFDYKLEGNYDKKEYKSTQGIFEQIELKKTITNGIEFSVGYRKAEGTQEYNNIKTGQDGEFISSIKIPFNSIVYNINQSQLDLKNAEFNTKAIHQIQRKNLLRLYLKIVEIYYKVLLQKEILVTEKELLNKSKKNLNFISKSIKEGTLPNIASLEIQEQILNRELRVSQANNDFHNVKNTLISYLNISNKSFDKIYEFGTLPKKSLLKISYAEAIESSLKNYPEVRKFDTYLAKNKISQLFTQTKKYPKFDARMYANYDLKYKEGYKLSFNLDFPLQRSSYKGKKESLKEEFLLIKSQKNALKLEISLRIKNIFLQINTQKKLIELSNKQLELTSKLEEIEKKKYFHGLGNLMFINQREINTLKVKQKQLRFYYTLQLLDERLQYYLAKHF